MRSHPFNMVETAYELHKAGKYEEAKPIYEQSLYYSPSDVAALRSYGACLGEIGDFEGASAALNKAIALDPLEGESWRQLGRFLLYMGSVDEAIEVFDRSLMIAPLHPSAMHTRAESRLVRGEWGRGWEEYEWRMMIAGQGKRTLQEPLKRARDTQGKKILVVFREGRGDALMMMRYLPWLSQYGEVVCELHPELIDTIMRLPVSFAYPRPIDFSLPFAFDCYVSAMSLPLLHMQDTSGTGEPIWDGPYIHSDASKVPNRVGICFHGNADWRDDKLRSMPDEYGADLIDRVNDLGYETLSLMPDTNTALVDYRTTADFIKSCERVITTDTSVAHLAGAMGAKTLVLPGCNVDWRWGISGEDSAWYPLSTIRRQDSRGDWHSSIRKAIEWLRQ